jgi:hypothetical protein
MRYGAHALDLFGVSLTDYEFECATDEDAKKARRELFAGASDH